MGLVGFVWRWALQIGDVWMDQRIEALPIDQRTKAGILSLENEAVRFLETEVGQKAAVMVGKFLVSRAVKLRFPNDPSTANWG